MGLVLTAPCESYNWGRLKNSGNCRGFHYHNLSTPKQMEVAPSRYVKLGALPHAPQLYSITFDTTVSRRWLSRCNEWNHVVQYQGPIGSLKPLSRLVTQARLHFHERRPSLLQKNNCRRQEHGMCGVRGNSTRERAIMNMVTVSFWTAGYSERAGLQDLAVSRVADISWCQKTSWKWPNFAESWTAWRDRRNVDSAISHP